MNLPQLPTDNLYKFMALAGVALFILSAFYPIRLIGEIQLRQVETETGIALASAAQKNLELEFQLLQRNPATTLEDAVALRAKGIELSQQTIRLEGEHRKSGVLVFQLIALFSVAAVTLTAGLLLAICGFKLWYLRVQKPTDLQFQQMTPNNSFKPKPLRGSA